MTSLTNHYRTPFLGTEALTSIKQSISTGQHSVCYSNHLQFDQGSVQILARHLPWDSQVLQQSVARIDSLYLQSNKNLEEAEQGLRNILSQLDQQNVQLTDIRIGFHALPFVQLSERCGFQLVDVLNIYLSRSAPTLLNNKNYQIIIDQPLTTLEEEQMINISSNSFLFSRLYHDPQIAKKTADHFYRELTSSLIKNPQARLGRVVDQQKNVLGFFISGTETLPVSNTKLGSLWLLSVHPQHTGKGIGRVLFDSFLQTMHTDHQLVEIGTQVQNESANALYRSFGLPVVANIATLHRWQ